MSAPSGGDPAAGRGEPDQLAVHEATLWTVGAARRAAQDAPSASAVEADGDREALGFRSLEDAAALVARREVSALELVDAVLARVEEVGPRLNCFVHVFARRAREEAGALDRLLAAGTRLGPLHGIPVTVKDNIAAAGAPTTAGSPVTRHVRPGPSREDAEAVRRLRAAGAIVLAKTTLYEFAFGEASDEFGPTRNPWSPAHSTGGSSSGSVAAVAAGLGYASLATDTGGSIRVPAAFCGVVGLKPTYGLVPTDGLIPVSPALDHVGPITRSARDARIVLRALAPHGVSASGPPVETLTLGIPAAQRGERCSEDVREAVAAVATTLAARGARLVEVGLPDLLAARAALWVLASVDAAEQHRSLLDTHADAYHPVVRARLERGARVSGVAYVRAQRVREELRRALADVLELVDAVVLPAAAVPPYALGARRTEVAGMQEDVADVVTRYTPLFSLAGCPAIALPCGRTADGLPLGAQIAAGAGRDDVVLALAEAYQAATPWHRRRPVLDDRLRPPRSRGRGVDADVRDPPAGRREGSEDG